MEESGFWGGCCGGSCVGGWMTGLRVLEGGQGWALSG